MKVYWNYLKAVLVHKFYFLVYGLKYGVSLDLLFTHDLSKLGPSEFVQYARYFYGTYLRYKEIPNDFRGFIFTRETVYAEFDKAWNHHQKMNKHHWQYWVLMNDDGADKVIEIPMRYLKEMLCDWLAANKAFGNGRIWEWYWENVSLLLHPNSQEWLEVEIDELEYLYKLDEWIEDELPFA
jgi:hypothetical protein